MILKQLIKYPNVNVLEATWVEVTTEEYEAPIMVINETGVEIDTGNTEIKTREIETVIKCHAYADVQMNMLRADAKEMGTSLAEHEDVIAEVEANIIPYVAPALTEQDFTIAIQTHLDTTAQKTKWDNMQSARSCAGIPLDGTETDIEIAMHADAVKLARWYLKIWAYGYAQLDLINKGERAVPVSVEAFISELPILGA